MGAIESENETSWAAQRKLQKEFSNEMASLCQAIGESGNLQLAQELPRQLLAQRDPARTYIFLPPENKLGDDRFESLADEIRPALLKILEQHANQLFELATKEAGNGHADSAITEPCQPRHALHSPLDHPGGDYRR